MFQINDDLSINITRGDIGAFTVDVLNESGEKYLFQKGDVVRIKVTEKKACENVMFQKDFVVEEETEEVVITLTEQDTKIGEVISKPTDYWYEIELNPFTNPQTIIGYDEDGAKIFKLFPEGKDVEPVEPTPEDIPVVDEELDLTSERPVQNQAITRAMLNLQEEIERVEDTKNITIEDLEPLAVGIEENKGNIAKNKGSIEDLSDNVENLSNTLDTHTADKNNPHNVTAEQTSYDNSISGMNADSVQGAIDELKGTIGYTSPNLLKYPYDRTAVNSDGTLNSSGILWTVNNDGSVSCSGTSNTNDSNIVLWNRLSSPLKLKKGKYILSGCPKGGSANTYSLVIVKTVGSTYEIVANDFGDGAEFELTEDTNVGVLCKVWSSGVNLNENHTYYPMIRYASIEDDTFEPYVEDVQTKLNDSFIKKAYTVSLKDNSLASPFTKYASVDITDDVNKYGQPITLVGFDDNYVPALISLRSATNTVVVCSNKATVYMYVVYTKLKTKLVT